MIFKTKFIQLLKEDVMNMGTEMTSDTLNAKHLQANAGMNNGTKMIADYKKKRMDKVAKVEILLNREAGKYVVTPKEISEICVKYNSPDLADKLSERTTKQNPKYIRNTRIMLYYDPVASNYVIEKGETLKKDK